MATQEELVTIAVLKTQVDELSKQVSGLNNKFDLFSANFLRADLYALRHEELISRISRAETDIKSLKSSRWLLGMISIVAAGTVGFLIQYALTH